jgi:RNA methyltransferase, TrmH family
VVEGVKLLEEALAAGVAVEEVLVAPGGDHPVVAEAAAAGARVHRLAPGVLERAAPATTPQPVAAVAPFVDVGLAAVSGARLVVVAADVRDPGNAGTILRSAEGAGADAVVLAEGSVDLYNPKTVRASAGALFHVPVVVGGAPAAVLDQLGRGGLRRLGTAARGGAPYDEADLVGPLALVLGNEARGLPPDLAGHLDEVVHIPMVGRTESLNVGMAAAVLCFEAARQRRRAAPGGAVRG